MMACCSISGKLVTLLFSFTFVTIYLIIGALVFQAIELPAEIKHHRAALINIMEANVTASPAVQNLTYRFNASACGAYEAIKYYELSEEEAEDKYSWTYTMSMMFAFSVITTLGYGAITPVTHIGKGMCMLFAVTSIPIYYMMIMLYATHALQLLGSLVNRTTSDINKATLMKRGTLLGLLFVAGLVFAIVFSVAKKCSFGDALWFTLCTFVPIGFGDVSPDHDNSVFMLYFVVYVTMVYIIVGMVVLESSASFKQLHSAVQGYSNSLCGICCNITIHHGALQAREPGMKRLPEEPVEAEMEAVEFGEGQREEEEDAIFSDHGRA